MDAERFVFLDETGATTAMTRLYGWGPRGERLVDAAPYGHWKTTTFVAGLRSDGVIAPCVLDGLMTGEVFRAYVEQMLAPSLRPGDAVVISPPTRLRASARRPRRRAQACSTCRPTRRT
jgi:DDE superfamily endonuclease